MRFKIGSLLAVSFLISGTFILPVRSEIAVPLVKEFRETYSSIQNQVNSLDKILEEVKSKAKNRVEAEADKITGGIKENFIKVGDDIEAAVSKAKTDVMEVNSRILGKNARTEYHQITSREQAGEEVLGKNGRELMAQEREAVAVAAQTVQAQMQASKGENITQHKIQRLINQNAQIASMLQTQQVALQRQNELSAMANLNLGDISESLSREQIRKQNQRQGAANAIYNEKTFLNKFWSAQYSR